LVGLDVRPGHGDDETIHISHLQSPSIWTDEGRTRPRRSDRGPAHSRSPGRAPTPTMGISMDDDETILRGPGRPRGARTGTGRRKPPGPPTKQADAEGQVVCVRYSKVVTAKICERIANGEAWYRICNRDGLPAYGTLYHWE